MTSERHIFIKNWVLQAPVGVYAQEKGVTQRLRLNIIFFQKDTPAIALADVIDYAAHKARITALVQGTHHELLETLAHKIAAICLDDPHMTRISVQLEKLDIFADCESCGVTVVRQKI